MAAWQYWQLYVTDSNGDLLDLAEVEMRLGGVDQTTPAGAVTAASASSTFSGLPAYLAFDDNTSTRWAASGNTFPQWLRYNFGAPQLLDEIRIYPKDISARSPRDFIIQCSNDAIDWVNAKIVTDEPGWNNSYKSFTFTPPEPPYPGNEAQDSTLGAYVVYKDAPADVVRDSTFGAFAVYAPAPTKIVRDGLTGAYVVYEMNPNNIPQNSTFGAYVVWTTGAGEEARTRAWTFTLDGHIFYVLDLGQEGTFLYDITTQQWCRWQTAGFEGWNVRAGVMWGEYNRIVGGDTLYGTVWEVDPDVFLDEGFRDIEHVATAGVMTRSRRFYAVEAVRIAGSQGLFTSEGDAELKLRFSDDQGETWVAMPNAANDQGELAWRSLGSFTSPGRVFEVSDVGGMYRIDGADVYIEDFDGEDD